MIISSHLPKLFLKNLQRNPKNFEHVLFIHSVPFTTTTITTPTTTITTRTTVTSTIMVLVYLPIVTIARRGYYDLRHLEKLKGKPKEEDEEDT